MIGLCIVLCYIYTYVGICEANVTNFVLVEKINTIKGINIQFRIACKHLF